mgnify:CR=1 FL=1
MQYVKELPNGDRIRVTKDQYDADRLGFDAGQLVHLVRNPTATIYHMNGGAYKPFCSEPLRFGGRRRGFATGHTGYRGN